LKPYAVWNGIISFEWRGKRIFLRVNNLFNEKYFSRGIIATRGSFGQFGPSITPPGTHLFVNPGASREFVVGATWEFGEGALTSGGSTTPVAAV